MPYQGSESKSVVAHQGAVYRSEATATSQQSSKMSHTVTVTRMTTSSSTSTVLLNVGYLKTIPGILKLLHVVLGVICVGLAGHYISYHKNYYTYTQTRGYYTRGYVEHALFVPELFFLLIATTCLIASFLLLCSCFLSIATAAMIPKTIYEIMYHVTAMILLLVSGITYLIYIETSYNYSSSRHTGRMVAAEITYFLTTTFLLSVASIVYVNAIVVRNSFEPLLHYNDEDFGDNEASKTHVIVPKEPGYGAKIFCGILGIINALLYGVAAFFAYRKFKGP